MKKGFLGFQHTSAASQPRRPMLERALLPWWWPQTKEIAWVAPQWSQFQLPENVAVEVS
jgi:hypothetical protein